MLRDPRYAAERWLAANIPAGTKVLILGGLRDVPRLHNYQWVQRVRRREGIPAVVVHSGSLSELKGLAVEEWVRAKKMAIALRIHGDWGPVPLRIRRWIGDLSGLTNLEKLNPTVTVFRRVSNGSNVVELVDGGEAHEQRWVAVLLQQRPLPLPDGVASAPRVLEVCDDPGETVRRLTKLTRRPPRASSSCCGRPRGSVAARHARRAAGCRVAPCPAKSSSGPPTWTWLTCPRSRRAAG